MKPDQFLQLARGLISSPHAGAAEFRTSVSRSYYYVYHAVKSLVTEELSISIKGSGGRDNLHLLLQQYLLNSAVDEAMEAGRILADLHEHRKTADYDLSSTKAESQMIAALCIARSERLKYYLDLCSASPLRARVIAGLTQYKRLRQGLT